jgi:hypothetical protein
MEECVFILTDKSSLEVHADGRSKNKGNFIIITVNLKNSIDYDILDGAGSGAGTKRMRGDSKSPGPSGLSHKNKKSSKDMASRFTADHSESDSLCDAPVAGESLDK